MKVFVFDFDGTITSKDTLWEFLKFSQSKIRLYCGLLLLSPVMGLYVLKIISNGRAKEILFSWFFKGWSLQRFNKACISFSSVIDRILRSDMMDIILKRKNEGGAIYIVSASIENWIVPWAEKQGITVLATQIETDLSQGLTGKFKSKNCYGEEKVKRLQAVLPDRKSYCLCAYGDSKGDQAMIDFADEGYFV